MGNFASSTEWVNSEPVQLEPTLPLVVKNNSSSDIITSLVSSAITRCKQALRRVFTRGCSDEPTHQKDNDEWMDEILGEFQIVYEPNYTRKRNETTQHKTAIDIDSTEDECEALEPAPWCVMSPADFETIAVSDAGKCKPQDFDDDHSATDCSEWLSDSDCKSELSDVPISSDSELDEFDFLDDDCSDVKNKAARLLRMASSVEVDEPVFVADYLCTCGECPQYNTIAADVARVVTWHEPEEIASITRVLQAVSTYNEAIGYHPDMIATADECLRVWCGDEDQAFTSFVLLQDEVPYLCAGTV